MISFLEAQILESNFKLKSEFLYKNVLYHIEDNKVIINAKLTEKEIDDLFFSNDVKIEINEKNKSEIKIIIDNESFFEIEPGIFQFEAIYVIGKFSTKQNNIDTSEAFF